MTPKAHMLTVHYRIACKASLKEYERDIAPAKGKLMALYDAAIVIYREDTAMALERHMARLSAALGILMTKE